MQQLGVQVVLAHILARTQHARRALHGADVGLRADAAGFAQDGLLMPILEKAHFVEQRAHIVLLGRAQRAVAHARTHRVEPAFDPRGQAAVRGKGVPDAGAVLQQPGQPGVELGRRERGVDAERSRRRCGPEPVAVPDLALKVFGLAKQAAAAVMGQHQAGTRLGETGQVIKVAVVAV